MIYFFKGDNFLAIHKKDNISKGIHLVNLAIFSPRSYFTTHEMLECLDL